VLNIFPSEPAAQPVFLSMKKRDFIPLSKSLISFQFSPESVVIQIFPSQEAIHPVVLSIKNI